MYFHLNCFQFSKLMYNLSAVREAKQQRRNKKSARIEHVYVKTNKKCEINFIGKEEQGQMERSIEEWSETSSTNFRNMSMLRVAACNVYKLHHFLQLRCACAFLSSNASQKKYYKLSKGIFLGTKQWHAMRDVRVFSC